MRICTAAPTSTTNRGATATPTPMFVPTATPDPTRLYAPASILAQDVQTPTCTVEETVTYQSNAGLGAGIGLGGMIGVVAAVLSGRVGWGIVVVGAAMVFGGAMWATNYHQVATCTIRPQR